MRPAKNVMMVDTVNPNFMGDLGLHVGKRVDVEIVIRKLSSILTSNLRKYNNGNTGFEVYDKICTSKLLLEKYVAVMHDRVKAERLLRMNECKPITEGFTRRADEF